MNASAPGTAEKIIEMAMTVTKMLWRNVLLAPQERIPNDETKEYQ